MDLSAQIDCDVRTFAGLNVVDTAETFSGLEGSQTDDAPRLPRIQTDSWLTIPLRAPTIKVPLLHGRPCVPPTRVN